MTIYNSCLHSLCHFIEAYVLRGCSFKNIRIRALENGHNQTYGAFRAKTECPKLVFLFIQSDALLMQLYYP